MSGNLRHGGGVAGLVHEALLEGVAGNLHGSVKAGLFADAFEIRGDGLFAQVELGGDFLRRPAEGDEAEDFEFAPRELGVGRVGGFTAQARGEAIDGGGAEVGLAVEGLAGGDDEFVGGIAFVDVPGGTGLQGPDGQGAFVGGGEDEDGGGGAEAFELAEDGDAVLSRHVQVEQDEIPRRASHGVERRGAVGGFLDTSGRERFGQQLAKAAADDFVIVSDQKSEHGAGGLAVELAAWPRLPNRGAKRGAERGCGPGFRGVERVGG